MGAIEPTRPSLTVRVAVALAVAAALVTIPLAVVSLRGDEGGRIGEWLVGCFTPGFLVSGWWLVVRRPDLVIGRLYVAAGLTTAVAGLAGAYAAAALAQGWPGVGWSLWVFSWVWQPHSALISVAFVLFPDGVPWGRWSRRLIGLILGLCAVSMLVSAVRPGPIVTTPDHLDGVLPDVVNPLGLPGAGFLSTVALVLLATGFLGAVPIVITAVRWRRSQGVRRRQFRWVTWVQVAGLVVPFAVFGLPGEIGPVAAITETLAVQVLVVVAILQWRAYEVDVVIRRSVLAGALLVAGLGTYAAVVVVVAQAIGGFGPLASAAGAAVAIFAFGPLSTWIRGGVNRLFYGRRDDPYTVLATLGRQLAHAPDPAGALDDVVVAVTEQLRLPYAAILDDTGLPLAQAGAPGPSTGPGGHLDVGLEHHGEHVGVLRVGYRRGTDAMTPAETELVHSLAHPIGAATAAHRLVANLQTARERLVVAREDERRHLQRELHDGLGPQLTAATLKLAAARNHLGDQGDGPAGRLLDEVRAELRTAVGDVRRVVYALGEPSVTALGLGAALADRVDQLARPAGLDVDLQVGALPALSAATEEAVYRIAVEAVNNVVRHAGARWCRVSLTAGGTPSAIVLEVDDDGCGIHPGWRAGVGTRSMRERTEELGGTFSMGPTPTSTSTTASTTETAGPTGTRVQACIPVGTQP